jgi:hypothetical protein
MGIQGDPITPKTCPVNVQILREKIANVEEKMTHSVGSKEQNWEVDRLADPLG